MPPGRSQRPLFDLIASKDANADAARRGAAANAAASGVPAPSAKPVIRVELKPREVVRDAESGPAPRPNTQATPPATASDRPRVTEPLATGSAPSGAMGAILGDQTVRLPRNVIFLALAAMVIVVVLVWALASSRGEARAVKALEKQFGAEVTSPDLSNPLVREPQAAPLSRDPIASPGARTSTANDRSKSSQTPTRNPPITADSGTAVITAKGGLAGDPRERGLNYCVLATLSGPDAKRAIDFLAENGVEAIGLPVDGRGRSGNNLDSPLTYQVIALPGITREEYAQKRTARSNLEANVTRLGQIWQREHRGTSNFARFGWTKYE